MKQRINALLLAALLVVSMGAVPVLAEETEPAKTTVEATTAIKPDEQGSLSFENLERRVRENNLNVLALQENVDALAEIDYEDLAEELRQNLNSMAKAMWGYTTGSMNVYVPEFGMNVSVPVEKDPYAHGQMEQLKSSLRQQFDDIKNGEMQKDNAGVIRQLKSYQDQIIMGGEMLYLTLVGLETQEGALERQLASLDRTVAEMKLRYQMGQISALQLQQVESGRTALVSGIQTLQMNISNLKCQLEVMVGEEMTGELTLSGVPVVTAEQLEKMDLEKDLAASKEVSYEIYAAGKTLEDAEEEYDDIWKSTKSTDTRYKAAVHTLEAAKFTHKAAIADYELRFRTLYAQVKDYAQILSAAETALEYEKGVYAAAELKRLQGTISENALLSAADTLKTAEEKAATASNDLFSSYNTYCWAVQHGILN